MDEHPRQPTGRNQTPPPEQASTRIAVLDNRDSFTFNIVHALLVAGADAPVVRADRPLGELLDLAPDGLIIGPGPGTPERAGCTLEALEHFAGQIPVLGICLGHQAIAVAHGARLRGARTLLHGRPCAVRHDGSGVLASIPRTFQATRYNSLVVEESSVPEALVVTALAEDGEVMGLRHQELALEGVQFHPEAIQSEHGAQLFENFVTSVRAAACVRATGPRSGDAPRTGAGATPGA